MNSRLVTILLILINVIISWNSFSTLDTSTSLCDKTIPSAFRRIFTHGSWSHLIGNLVVFFFLSTLEQEIGSLRYFIGLSIIILVQVLLDLFLPGKCSIGFSGVVLGLLVWNMTIQGSLTFGLTGIFTLAYIWFQSVVAQPGVSYSGHFYGIVAGVITGFFMNTILSLVPVPFSQDTNPNKQ